MENSNSALSPLSPSQKIGIGINAFILIWGILIFIIGGAMGGDAKIYLLFLVLIPVILIFCIRKIPSFAKTMSLVTVLYAAGLYYYVYGSELNIYSIVVYLILAYDFMRILTSKTK